MADFDIMSVRQMINSAFGDLDRSCPVDFNMVEAILFILARRMQLLKRHFKVQVSKALAKQNIPTSKLTITEIKIHTKKKWRLKQGILVDELLPSDKRLTGQIKRSTKKRSRTTSLHKSPARKRFSDDNSSGMSTDEEVSTKKSKAHKRSSKKHTSAKIYHAQRRKNEDGEDVSPDARRRAGKHFDEKLAGKRRKPGKYSDDTSPTERRKPGKYSDDISPDERKKYPAKMSPAERRKGGKYSDQMSSSARDGSGKYYSPPDKFSSESPTTAKYRSNKHSAQRGRTDAELYSQKDTGGQFRETGNLRKKRYGARQADDNDDDIEEQHEKIYVVTRTPSGRKIREPVSNPVVTQKQFKDLLARIRDLQNKFGTTKTWDDLRSSNSITHPKAAWNLSVRLDVAETRLAKILEVVEQLARQVPGIDVQTFLDERSLPPDTHRQFEVATPASAPVSEILQAIQTYEYDTDSDTSEEAKSSKPKDIVTFGLLNAELERIRDDVIKNVRYAMENAGLHKRELNLSKTDTVVNRLHHKFKNMVKLEFAVNEFGEKVAAVDEYLGLEMTTIQDNLLQMQVDLEMALDKMNEAFLAPKEDPAAVALITADFINYNRDLGSAECLQMDLKEELDDYRQNLKSIDEKIKVISNRKCTRDEMFDALKDKLTVKDINGILTYDQFGAVNADMKQTLKSLYLAIYTKEFDWQKIIDGNKTKVYECADIIQLESLEDSLQKCFTKMDDQVDEMFAIVGPLKKFPTDKKIERDDNCLSCGAPAETKKHKLGVKLWQEMVSSTPATVKFTDEEIAELCIPGQPIPHPLDLNSFICEHDCGDTVKTKQVFDMYIKDLSSRSNYDQATSDKKQNVGDQEVE